MDIQNLVLVVALFANLFLEILLLERTKNNWSVMSFAISVLTVALWTFTMIVYRAAGEENSLLWVKILYFSASLIPFTFLYFTLLFPSEKFTIPKSKIWLIAIPPASVIFFVLFPNLVIKDVLLQNGQEKHIIFGPLYPFYSIYISTYFGWALFNLFKKYKNSAGALRTQINYILTGTLISIVLGSAFNLVLPTLGNFRFNWLGQVATLVMVFFITYAIIKKQLFEIKVVLTELLVGVIAILLLVNIFASQTMFDYVWKGTLFVAFLIFGYLLIKSVLTEIKRRVELERLTLEIKIAYSKLEELDKAKTEFISIASHQLRTPLAAIKGYISMILEKSYGEVPEKIQKPLQNVSLSNERLIKLINDLLSVSRIEAGKIEMRLEESSIGEIIISVLEELENTAKKKGLYLKFESSKKLLPKISIDREKIRQTILNIVDNAIRYTNKGGVNIEIKNIESKIQIALSDTGEGMTKEEVSHLFESFSRGMAGTKFWTEGAGLGLYIAKKFVEMHGGKIWAESEGKGRGSTFYIELPRK